MVLEILGAILATSTAKSVAKFLDEKLTEYVNKKFNNKPPVDIEALKTEVEQLKEKLEAKKKDDITQTDVDELQKTVMKIEQKQNSLHDAIISDSILQEWSLRKERDVDDQAALVKRELEVILDKAKDLKIAEKKRWEIQDILVAIEMNLKEMVEAEKKARKYPGLVSAEQKAKEAEIGLRNTIFEATEYLKPYAGTR